MGSIEPYHLSQVMPAIGILFRCHYLERFRIHCLRNHKDWNSGVTHYFCCRLWVEALFKIVQGQVKLLIHQQ